RRDRPVARRGAQALMALLALLLAAQTVFQLVDNRTLAHCRVRGGLGMAAGAPGFAKYIRFGRSLAGWTLGERVDGRQGAWAAAQATLEVPLGESPGDTVYVRLRSAGKQSLRVAAGGKSSPAAAVAPGWQLVKLMLPAGALRRGENELRFTFGAAGRKA